MSGRNPVERPWSVPVALDEIPETGHRIELTPDAATRQAIAELAGMSGLPRLQAGFELVRHGRDAMRVVGSVSATVEQACVVTLEPIRNEIDETIDLLFTAQPDPRVDGGSEAPLAIDAEEPPEPLVDGVVDLGAVATEFLLLGIDPYPRKPDAVFDAPPAGDPAAHPFAALAPLKKGESKNSR